MHTTQRRRRERLLRRLAGLCVGLGELLVFVFPLDHFDLDLDLGNSVDPVQLLLVKGDKCVEFVDQMSDARGVARAFR